MMDIVSHYQIGLCGIRSIPPGQWPLVNPPPSQGNSSLGQLPPIDNFPLERGPQEGTGGGHLSGGNCPGGGELT